MVHDPTIITDKRRLRREAAARRDALEGRAERSVMIMRMLAGLPAYRSAAAIHCFLPIRSEVDTEPLVAAALAEGKAVAVPVIDERGVMVHSWLSDLAGPSLVRGPLGTLYPRVIRPAYPGQWELTIVPLLAFDRSGYRLGYGKGHYDRLLAGGAGLAVGVAFACQELDALPREPHDTALDLIITEAEVITPRRA